MNFLNSVKLKLKKHLQFSSIVNDEPIRIQRELSFENRCAINEIWYNGDSFELSQVYNSIYGNNKNSFWSASSTRGLDIRKFHTGLPKLIVNTLTNITISDLNNISFEDERAAELWSNIENDNEFIDTLKSATKDVLIYGDGAFKISFDDRLSKYPILEFYSGENVTYNYLKSKLVEIVFYNKFEENHRKYVLTETYGYGYILYNLYLEETEIPLNSLKRYENLENVYFDNSIMLAKQFMIYKSSMYKGRGASIYDGKLDSFDALDETVSQWLDSIRDGRVKTYIPSSLIPKGIDGAFLKPNPFDNKFIEIADNMAESSNNQITSVQPKIQVEALLQTYITMLDLALQGVISPSTIGIDVKKLDNAESQREKEKCTLYTRQIIISTITEMLKDLVGMCINAYSLQIKQEIIPFDEKLNVNVSFGEYANPSFEAVIETLSNPNTPMSIEAKVDELWGNSKTPEWKAEEVIRCKQEMGLISIDEPTII